MNVRNAFPATIRPLARFMPPPTGSEQWQRETIFDAAY